MSSLSVLPVPELEMHLPQPYDLFHVTIQRNSLGLGISIMGGAEAAPPFQHFIRVKRLFPLQPAWQNGQLQPGDILLKANQRILTGIGLRNALDILRSGPLCTTLLVCRPLLPDIALPVTDDDEIIRSQHRFLTKVLRSCSFTPATCLVQSPAETPSDSESSGGTFQVVLNKVHGSLGFSILSQAEGDSEMCHSVKALVKEPARSDGRIQPGDKLISANGVQFAKLSHEELIQFLRQCPDQNVQLTLYRDVSSRSVAAEPVSMQTPPLHPFQFVAHKKAKSVSSKSQPNLHLPHSSKPKQLRLEAKEMVRSLQASKNSLGHSSPSSSRNGSCGSGGRRRIRPFSPARNQGHSINLSSSAPSPFPGHLVHPLSGSEHVKGSPSPTIEFPITPVSSCALFDADTVTYSMEQLHIEELPAVPNHQHLDQDSICSDPFSSSSTSSLPAARSDRPTHLNLFSSGTRKPRPFLFAPSSSDNTDF